MEGETQIDRLKAELRRLIGQRYGEAADGVRAAKSKEDKDEARAERKQFTREGIVDALSAWKAESEVDVWHVADWIFANFLGTGRKSIPPAVALRWLVGTHLGYPDEVNNVLRLAGYLPVAAMPEFPGVIPAAARQELSTRLHNSQYPAFLVNQGWDVLDVNRNFARLMGVAGDFLTSSVHSEQRNALLLTFQEPFRSRLGDSPATWAEIAEINVRVFKIHNRDAAHLESYQKHVQTLLSRNAQLARLWGRIDPLQPFTSPLVTAFGPGGIPLSYYVPFNTSRHLIKAAHPPIVNLSPSLNSLADSRYPGIFFYVPRDKAAAAWFHEIGIRAPD